MGEIDATQVAPWVRKVAPLGFAAKGLVYVTVGVLAARAAIGAGGRTTDQKGALATLAELPFGRTLLAAVAIGLAAYAAWRVLSAFVGRHEGWKRVAHGVMHLAKAALHLGLAFAAARVARGGASGSGDESARGWTASFLAAPLGETLVLVGGLALVGWGAWQVVRATSGRFLRNLDLDRCSRRTCELVERVGLAGITARGLVFALVGSFLVRAAVDHDAGEARGLAGALHALGAEPWLLVFTALGLVCYGLFELAEARYRRL